MAGIKRLRPWLVIIGASALFVAGWSGILVKGPVICPLRRMTGVPCGSCGLTRAFDALCHGELMTAIHFHLAGPWLFMAGILIVLISCAELITGRALLGGLWCRWGRPAIWLTLVVILIGWGLNLAAYLGYPVLLY